MHVWDLQRNHTVMMDHALQERNLDDRRRNEVYSTDDKGTGVTRTITGWWYDKRMHLISLVCLMFSNSLVDWE